MLRQGGRRESAADREFGIALAGIGLAPNAGDDPLPYVSAQMQHQIADGVFVFRATRPDLVFSQAAQAIFDAASGLTKLAGGVVEEEAVVGVHQARIPQNVVRGTAL